MIQEITAMDLRQRLGAVLNEIAYKHYQAIITRGGKPMVVMIDFDTFSQKINPVKTQGRMRRFLQGVQADFSHYKFNRDDANAR